MGCKKVFNEFSTLCLGLQTGLFPGHASYALQPPSTLTPSLTALCISIFIFIFIIIYFYIFCCFFRCLVFLCHAKKLGRGAKSGRGSNNNCFVVVVDLMKLYQSADQLPCKWKLLLLVFVHLAAGK